MKATFLFAAMCIASPIVVLRRSDNAVNYPDFYWNKAPTSVAVEVKDHQVKNKRATEDTVVHPAVYRKEKTTSANSKDQQVKRKGPSEDLVVYPEGYSGHVTPSIGAKDSQWWTRS